MADVLERPLIVGASGQLGSELMKVFADCNVAGLDHSQIEVEDPDSIEDAFSRYRPTAVINTAAFHNVDECERQPVRAFAINAIAVDRLAAKCASAGAVFATMSSDYVFEGTKRTPYSERDDTAPLNVYGVSKRAGELCARRHGWRQVVFRTSGLYGIRTSTQKGHTFVDRLLRQVQNGEKPRIVNDITVSTSYAPDLARMMRTVLEREAYGIFHVTNSGGCTWYEFATEALRLAGMSSAIEAVSAAEFPGNAIRPKYSVLAHDALAALRLSMPPWEDALKRYIAERTVRS